MGAVIGAWLSPSHDGYLQPKAKASCTIGLSAGFRLELARRAVADDTLVAVAAWEVVKTGRWPDYPVVMAELESTLDELHENGKLQYRPTVFYACGTDHAAKCGLYRGMGAGRGVVVVPRLGEIPEAEHPSNLVYVAEPAGGEVSEFSSTKVRDAIAADDFGYVEKAMSASLAQFLLQPLPEACSMFQSDFEKLRVQAPSSKGRQIFISLSTIFHKWDQSGEAFLQTIRGDALFFFGSKHSWVFPVGEAEMKESLQNGSKYIKPQHQKIRDLIIQKEAKDQVFFLKPPGFIYNGSLMHGDPGAFPKASDWLTCHIDPLTGVHYKPLILDVEWWNAGFAPATAKYEQCVDSITMNFQCGAHDYGPVMELLHQSNPTLEIIH